MAFADGSFEGLPPAIRLENANALADLALAAQLGGDHVAPDHFQINDVGAGYLGAAMYADQRLRAAVNGQDPLVEFPPLVGDHHTHGYLGAMVLVSTRPAMVEGTLNGRRVVVPPNSRLADVLTAYLTGLA